MPKLSPARVPRSLVWAGVAVLVLVAGIAAVFTFNLAAEQRNWVGRALGDIKDSAGCTVPVGVIQTTGGTEAVVAAQLMQGYQLAQDEVNSAGGINGCPVVLRDENDGSTAAGARAAVGRLLDQDRVTMILGPSSSEVALAVAEEVQKRQSPLLIPVSVSSEIAGLGFTWVFKLSPDQRQITKTAFDFLESVSTTLPAPTLALLREDDPQFRRTEVHVTAEARARGLSLIAVEAMPSYDPDGRQRALDRLHLAKPEVVLLAMKPVPGDPHLFRDLATPGWSPKLVVDLEPEYSEPDKYTPYLASATLWVPGVAGRVTPEIEQAFRAHAGDTAGSPVVQGYVALQVAAQALTRAGQTTGRGSAARVRDALLGTRLDQSLVGAVAFDRRGQNQPQVLVAQFLDGRLAVVFPNQYRERPAVVPVPTPETR